MDMNWVGEISLKMIGEISLKMIDKNFGFG